MNLRTQYQVSGIWSFYDLIEMIEKIQKNSGRIDQVLTRDTGTTSTGTTIIIYTANEKIVD